jgi:transposase-like protein
VAEEPKRVLPRFCGHLIKAHNEPGGGVMVQRRRFSAEYKREAVAMLDAPGVNVSQIAAELGIGATVMGRWRQPRLSS